MKDDIFQSQNKQGRLIDSGSFPNVVLIDTISFCNLACSMCVHDKMTRKKGIMSWDLLTKILDEVARENINARVWMVFFGEAFIMKRRTPSIFDMIRYAKDKGLTDVVLNSNANLMDEETSRKLIDSGLDAIYIGIDAFSQETYSKLRVKGDYEKTRGNVLNLLKLQGQLKTQKPQVFVQFVEMDSNAHEKNAFIQFWTEHGVTVKIRPKVSWAGLIDAPNLILKDEDRWSCHWAMQTMSITDTGKVVTCPVDLDGRFIAGDVTENSLKDVWNGTLKQLRTLHCERRFSELPDICRQCKDWQSARSDYFTLNP